MDPWVQIQILSNRDTFRCFHSTKHKHTPGPNNSPGTGFLRWVSRQTTQSACRCPLPLNSLVEPSPAYQFRLMEQTAPLCAMGIILSLHHFLGISSHLINNAPFTAQVDGPSIIKCPVAVIDWKIFFTHRCCRVPLVSKQMPGLPNHSQYTQQCPYQYWRNYSMDRVGLRKREPFTTGTNDRPLYAWLQPLLIALQPKTPERFVLKPMHIIHFNDR